MNVAHLTCHRSFIQQQLESRGYVRSRVPPDGGAMLTHLRLPLLTGLDVGELSSQCSSYTPFFVAITTAGCTVTRAVVIPRVPGGVRIESEDAP
jgi:hypothetical protein